MAQTKITITHDKEVPGDLQVKLITACSSKLKHSMELRNIIEDIGAGNRMGKIATVIDNGDGVAASGTITLASLVAADTLTVGPEVFTSSASPSGNNQFLSTGGDTLVAAAAAAKIAAHPNLLFYVTATSALAVVTVTAVIVGRVGNNIPIAISAHGSVSGSGKLTSGADPTLGASTSYNFGV